MSNDNHPTERIRTDEALAERLRHPDSWSDDTKNEILIAALGKAMVTEKRAVKTNRKSNLSLAGAVIAILGGIGAAAGYSKDFAVFVLSRDFASVSEVSQINSKLDWMIRKLLPGESPPTFEERNPKEVQR